MGPGRVRAGMGVALWLVLAATPLRGAMEATLVGHMMGQLGLLTAAGWWLGHAFGPAGPECAGRYDRGGATGLLMAGFVLIFWALPVNLDRAVEGGGWELAKLVSVPLLAGLPLAKSWPRLPGVARAALWAQMIPMLLVMGWLYRESPVRLCNAYLLSQQDLLGIALWLAAAIIAAFWGAWLFIAGSGSPECDYGIGTGSRR